MSKRPGHQRRHPQVRLITPPQPPGRPNVKDDRERWAPFRYLRAKHMREHPTCEFQYEDGNICGRSDVTLHHKAGVIGDNLMRHLMTACDRHHRWIHHHRNRVTARARGYLIDPEPDGPDQDHDDPIFKPVPRQQVQS